MAAAPAPRHDGVMTETQPVDQAVPPHDASAASATSGAPGSAPGAPPAGGTTSPGASGFFDQIRSLGVRRSSDRWVAGVCGGLARRFGVDPLLIRAGLIALLIIGIGFLAYLVAWALLPDENESILAERAIRDGDGWGIFLIIVIALSVVGVGPFFAGSDGWWSLVVTVGLIAGVWWLVTKQRGGGQVAGAPASQPPAEGRHTDVGAPGTNPSAQGPTRPQPVWAPATASPLGYEAPAPGGARPAPARASSAYSRPKAPGAGLAGLLVALGAALLGYGVGQAVGAIGGASADLVAMTFATAAAGLSTVLLGLLGRRSALTSLLSIALTVSLLVTWGVTTAPEGGGETTWRPVAESTVSTYAWNAGQATLDLRGITERPDTREITASVSLGELVVYVPEDITTRVVSNAWLGGVTVTGGEASSSGQSQEGPTMTTEHVFGDGPADLTVNANVRLGSIRIVSPDATP